jgi:hypothetical protein
MSLLLELSLGWSHSLFSNPRVQLCPDLDLLFIPPCPDLWIIGHI